MKILIIRFSSIGDIVLTSPVIRVAKEQLGAEVHFLCKKQFSQLLISNPNLDKIHVLDDSYSDMIKCLEQENFDYIIDLHNNLRSFRVKKSLKIPSKSFYKANIEKWLMVNFKWNRLPKKHIVDRYMDTLSNLGGKNDSKGLDFFYKVDKNLLLKYNIKQPYICISLGAAHNTKQIPYELIDKTIALLKENIVLIGGKDVQTTGEKLELQHSHILNLCGKISISVSAQIIDQAQSLITGDTGMMHIGAALKKPLISLWGNTIPDFGMTPYFGKYKIKNSIIQKQLKCRPCSKTGFENCPKKHFNCMKQLTPIELVDAIRSIAT